MHLLNANIIIIILPLFSAQRKKINSHSFTLKVCNCALNPSDDDVHLVAIQRLRNLVPMATTDKQDGRYITQIQQLETVEMRREKFVNTLSLLFVFQINTVKQKRFDSKKSR